MGFEDIIRDVVDEIGQKQGFFNLKYDAGLKGVVDNSTAVSGIVPPSTIEKMLTDHTFEAHKNLGFKKVTITLSTLKPTFGGPDELFVETDTDTIYRGTGLGWADVGHAQGSGSGLVWEIPALEPGDVFMVNKSSEVEQLPPGPSGTYFMSRGIGETPVWQAI